MNRNSSRKAVIAAGCVLFIASVVSILLVSECYASGSGPSIVITKRDLKWIGETIYKKECNSDPSRLVSWNRGETFASIGIGHFIWYPDGQRGPFEESFPSFIAFARKRGLTLPKWIEDYHRNNRGCPWKSRRDFYYSMNSYKMQSLKSFMKGTMYEQSLFIVLRFKKSLPKMLRAAPSYKRNHIKNQFYRLAGSSRQLYALIDYVNFKGEGVKLTERYNDQGWGLLQVLEEMRGTGTGYVAVSEFSRAAETVLLRRVSNSPPERNEGRWLSGWKNRVSYYRTL